MATKISQLAKLTRPRLHKAVARERLFDLLDEARTHKSAICVVGPPGAGKTTLVASWLDSRAIKGIWYQVDPGDADLATFFYYLGLAAKPFTRKGQRQLPILTPEYLHDVDGFSRRFFRQLFPRLPNGAVLVLDNYQEVDAGQPFHRHVSHAVEEVPPGITLIAISRRDPPDCYARLVANENVQLVQWEALKLTREEAQAIAKSRARLADAELARLYQTSGGWAAGFTLLLEGRLRKEGAVSNDGASRAALFDYFAAQIFGKLPPTTQEFLVATALLPQVPVSIAQELIANSEAEAILEDLYRRNLFTHKRIAHEPVYWYHALFREYLVAQADHFWSVEQHCSLLCRAGRLLETHGDTDGAFQLLCQAQAWQQAEALALRQAFWLLGQGRGETLRAWISALPKAIVDLNAWLRYWLGVSLVPVDQIQARASLESAFDAFRNSGDIMGQMRSISSIIDTYFFEWSHWQPLDRWIEALEPLMLAGPAYPSQEVEFDIHCSMLIATLYRRPGHTLLQACVDRVFALLESELDVNRKVVGATLLLTFCNLASRADLARNIVALAEPFLKQPGVTPFNRVWWRNRLTYFQNACGDHEAVRGTTQEVYDLIETYGLKGLGGAALLVEWHLGWAMMAARHWHEAERSLQRMEQLARKSRPSDLLLITVARFRFAMARGELALARTEAPRALAEAKAVGMIYQEAMYLAGAVEVYAESGLNAEAREQASIAHELVRGTCFEYLSAEIRVIEAYMELREGKVECSLRLLRQGLSQAALLHPNWIFNASLSGRVLSMMCAEALEAGIEVPYVRSLVRRFRFQPPSVVKEEWPWCAKIYTLGRFELWCDDQRVQFAGKVPKKPLALLKALIANGGASVPEERVMDALWPDEQADAARKSLDITVLRLRKLLGSNDTILVRDELISLNPQLCWSDVWAFEQRIKESETDCGSAAEALALYRGNFLPAEIEEPWTVKSRERLRAKFVRLVEATAQADEAAGRFDKAITLYLKGLEADDLVEAFHLGLMRCYRALGRPAEALTAFRRLRQTLSVVLGIAPSPDAEKMARDLKAIAPRVSPE